jgi:hypothetical protein
LIGKPEEKGPLRRSMLKGWIILKWILKTGWEVVVVMYLAYSRDQWRVLRVP